MVNKHISIFMFNVQNEIASVRDHVFSYQCTRSYVSLLVHVIIIIIGLFTLDNYTSMHVLYVQ